MGCSEKSITKGWGKELFSLTRTSSLKNISASTNVGRRKINEDGFLFAQNKRTLLAVSDGVGGSAGGDIAASEALEELSRRYIMGDFDLGSAVLSANQKVIDAGNTHGMPDCSCTIAAAEIHDNSLNFLSAGDSRVYMISRSSGIQQLSIDHSRASEAFQNTVLRHINTLHRKIDVTSAYYEFIRTYERLNPINSFLGLRPELLELYKNDFPISLNKGDRVLLCTDGIYNFIPYSEFSSILMKFESVKNTVDMLMKFMAKEMMLDDYEYDNFTALLYEETNDLSEA